MSKNSVLEEIVENSFKHPKLGAVGSILSLCIGIYFTVSHGSSGPASAIFSGVNKLLANFFYGFSVFTAILAFTGYLMNKDSEKKRHEFFESKKTLLSLKQLSWKEFELFVGSFFEKQGYSVEVTGGLRDGGIDLIVTKDGRASFVQCKKYRENQVTLSMMRDFYGAMSSQRNANPGFFVATGTFTLDARKFAEENAIEAIDGSRLMEYLKTMNVSVPYGPAGSTGRVASAKKQESRMCPDCGAPMVVRVAKKGAHVNEPFWGCSNYPKCRAISAYSGKA